LTRFIVDSLRLRTRLGGGVFAVRQRQLRGMSSVACVSVVNP
jgi:hypothetical protein